METELMETDRTDLISMLFESDNGTERSVEMPSAELTEKIIGCAYKVSNTLGCGFLEKVYENSLAHELRKSGFRVTQQQKIDVVYDGIVVGFYEADIIVEDQIIIEVKALRAMDDAHKANV